MGRAGGLFLGSQRQLALPERCVCGVQFRLLRFQRGAALRQRGLLFRQLRAPSCDLGRGVGQSGQRLVQQKPVFLKLLPASLIFLLADSELQLRVGQFFLRRLDALVILPPAVVQLAAGVPQLLVRLPAELTVAQIPAPVEEGLDLLRPPVARSLVFLGVERPGEGKAQADLVKTSLSKSAGRT